MKYRVAMGGQTLEVDIQASRDGKYDVRVDGAPFDADVVFVPGGVNLIVAGRVYDLVAVPSSDGAFIAVDGLRTSVGVQNERQIAARKKRGGAGTASKELRSPMPGRVLRVLCKVGDEIPANQTLVVVEAMKMENELRVPFAAKVAAVAVSEGASIESNAVLIRFE